MTSSFSDAPVVRERTWTKEEYYRLGDLGFFRGQRVELLGGRLMVMSPMGPEHAGVVLLVTQALQHLFPSGYLVRPQLPLDLGVTTEPEPDVAVVPGTVRDYLAAHPTAAVLVVEVSDSTLAYDRGRKAGLYASVGIPDYWIVNLVTPQVEVYRDPLPDAGEPFGYRYGSRADHLPGDRISPLLLANGSVAVADLLP